MANYYIKFAGQYVWEGEAEDEDDAIAQFSHELEVKKCRGRPKK